MDGLMDGIWDVIVYCSGERRESEIWMLSLMDSRVSYVG